jgi:hypothetical protein
MPRIENMAVEDEVANSLLGPEAESEQQAPEQPVSEYAVSGADLLNEQIAEDRDNIFRDGDEQHERLRSERPEAETGEEQPHQGRKQPDAQQESEETQQAVEPTPAQVAEVIQDLDARIQDYGLSDPADTAKFGSELASAFGADVHRDGWNVGLLNSTIARTALAAGRAVEEAGGDLSRIGPLSKAVEREVSRDVLVSFGIDPRLNPAHDERLVAHTIYFGMANLIDTMARMGETDPAKVNDAQMAVWFCESLQKGIFGVDKPVSRERACQVVDCLARRVLGMDARVREWQERNQAAQAQSKRAGVGRGRGQRIPAQFRDGIKGSKAPRFKSNQDIFDGGAQDYQQQHGRL